MQTTIESRRNDAQRRLADAAQELWTLGAEPSEIAIQALAAIARHANDTERA